MTPGALDPLSDAELERWAAKAAARRSFLSRQSDYIPFIAAIAALGGIALLFKCAALVVSPVLAPCGVILGSACGIGALIRCCQKPPQERLDRKWANELEGIDNEKKMRRMERLPSLQEKLAAAAGRFREAFSNATGHAFHQGTEEPVIVSAPLRLKKTHPPQSP